MTVAAAPRRPDRARRRMRVWLLAIAGAVVVAIVATALLGGFRDRTAELRVAPRGEPVDTGEVTVELTDARITTDGPEIRFPTDQRFLVVRAVVENHTDAPVRTGTVSVLVRGATLGYTDRPRNAVRTADGGTPFELQPELRTPIAWLWPIESGAVIPSGRLDAVVIAQPRKLGDPIFDDATYEPFEAIARVRLPVGGIP